MKALEHPGNEELYFKLSPHTNFLKDFKKVTKLPHSMVGIDRQNILINYFVVPCLEMSFRGESTARISEQRVLVWHFLSSRQFSHVLDPRKRHFIDQEMEVPGSQVACPWSHG